MLLLSVAGIVGIETSSFVAVLGAAGLAIGLALQGSLANFAGGVLILIFKPYRVGDLITAQGFTGTVEGVQIFNTVLVTPDNKTIIIPNGSLSTSPITNNSGKGEIRVDMVFAAGSQNGIDKIRESLDVVVKTCPSALKDKQHDILVTKLTENAIFFDVRVWTCARSYWDTYYFVTKASAASSVWTPCSRRNPLSLESLYGRFNSGPLLPWPSCQASILAIFSQVLLPVRSESLRFPGYSRGGTSPDTGPPRQPTERQAWKAGPLCHQCPPQ
nr:mechanosensitive ion channel family protein [uncultured Dyadobacter sp.]